MESRSKFACLRIDDDSDNENFAPAVQKKKGGQQNKKQNNGNQQRNNPKSSQGSSGGGYIVHAIEKRPRVKKGGKPKVVDPATGLVVQDADANFEEEQKFKEDLRLAMKESRAEASQRQSERSSSAEDSPESGFAASVTEAMGAIEKEARSRNAPSSDTDSLLITLYKSKLTENVEKLLRANQEVESSRAEAERLRTKYKKLVELFKDAELAEKARLVLDLDRARSAETELATQLAVAQSNLEQARSRIRQLEGKK